jgi:predicted TIM-barrel fold metal-dependent hydrolase
MRMDAHQHFWMYNPHDYGWIADSMTVLRRDFLPPDLEPELARNQFQGSVAVQARQSRAAFARDECGGTVRVRQSASDAGSSVGRHGAKGLET